MIWCHSFWGFVCQILDTGWVDLLAPDLDQMVSVCSTMKTWLQTHPKHVLVLHCRVTVTDSSALIPPLTVWEYWKWNSPVSVVVLYREVKAGSEFWWLLTSTSATCQPGNTDAMWIYISCKKYAHQEFNCSYLQTKINTMTINNSVKTTMLANQRVCTSLMLMWLTWPQWHC